MIERQIVAANVKELEIQEYVTTVLKNLGQSHIKLQKTPLGEKIIIHASRPGLIVGRKGQNIKRLTEDLKEKFKLENPQIEINEVESPDLDAQIVAERVASSLEKFGTQRFKGIGHKIMADVMNAGAMGVEILISGKIPSSRAKRWRFYQGYLKKCGDIAIIGVRKAYSAAQLKTGTVGIQVRIMPPDLKLPDDVVLYQEEQQVTKEMKSEIRKKAGKDDKKEASKGKDEGKPEAERAAGAEGEKKKRTRKTAKKQEPKAKPAEEKKSAENEKAAPAASPAAVPAESPAVSPALQAAKEEPEEPQSSEPETEAPNGEGAGSTE
ncbi:30S ribosomal protein S3 [Candidatus Woesearchaeota archaeon]|nr:30S ribosomal protein S3 [Candidatus Woesearchaeota archaeon]